MIVVYLDDILVSSNCNKSLDLFIDYLKGLFEVRVEAKIQTFHGFTVDDFGSSVKLHHAPMITRMLKEY